MRVSFKLKCNMDIVSFLRRKTLKAIVGLVFLYVFQSSIIYKYFIPYQLCLFINGLIFEILCRSFLISPTFSAIVVA